MTSSTRPESADACDGAKPGLTLATDRKTFHMKTSKTYRFETLAVHAGHGVDPATGAVVEPQAAYRPGACWK
jgi:hypothetical protein